MNSHQLFRRSRFRLAFWYAGVMAVILSLSGLSLYRSLIQSNWEAMEREMESIAGTLHDSLEPMLPPSGEATRVLKRILPELCVAGESCNINPTFIERHTTGISDRNTYYIRLFNHEGTLLAFSPSQPLGISRTFHPEPWQTFQSLNGIRYHQFTIILHNHYPSESSSLHHSHPSWGYLQIGRTLEAFDGEVQQMQWILGMGFSIALGLVMISSWWLSGLAMQPIYQSYQQQQQFTANAAHELRSPLASLLATVEAMLRLPPANQSEIPLMLQTVERQGRRLSHLISDLLLLTSLEQNSSPIPFKSCCLNDLISDLTEEFLELALIAELHLVSHIPEAEIYVLGHESQLYRLVSNLIANAIQYTPSGGKVVIELNRRDRLAVITVKDTGIGIAPQEQTRIFERFYRVDSDRSRNTGGTGLGLAIVQAIGKKHQAHLSVESRLGYGSIFTVELAISSVIN